MWLHGTPLDRDIIEWHSKIREAIEKRKSIHCDTSLQQSLTDVEYVTFAAIFHFKGQPDQIYYLPRAWSPFMSLGATVKILPPDGENHAIFLPPKQMARLALLSNGKDFRFVCDRPFTLLLFPHPCHPSLNISVSKLRFDFGQFTHQAPYQIMVPLTLTSPVPAMRMPMSLPPSLIRYESRL